MGLPLGPLMANVFMCSIEDRLQDQGKLPEFYTRYVDDTLSIMPDTEKAEAWNLANTVNFLSWERKLCRVHVPTPLSMC